MIFMGRVRTQIRGGTPRRKHIHGRTAGDEPESPKPRHHTPTRGAWAASLPCTVTAVAIPFDITQIYVGNCR